MFKDTTTDRPVYRRMKSVVSLCYDSGLSQTK